MYVTGGIGPSKHNDGFTRYYDLPNDSAYCETCASVALIFWAQRMLNIDLEGRYADILEQSLYNGSLSGLSRDGTRYFYENPLASDGTHRRWEWHPCPCCTMNVSRLAASVGGYFYSTGNDTLAVHLYGGAAARHKVGERTVGLRETSNYPWSGAIRLTIDPDAASEFTLMLRIPGWARSADAKINGAAIDTTAPRNGYLAIRRIWQAGDTVELDLPMPIERIYANPLVEADNGRTALKRGPLVYCAEQADNGNLPVDRLRLPRDASLSTVERADLFNGIITIVADGAMVEDWGDDLYRTAPPAARRVTWHAIPYYLWNNRQPGPMRVWVPEI
jgi:DUF1680 family protein